MIIRETDVTEGRVLVHVSVSVPSVPVKYSGYLEHMDKPFDSNCFRKTPRLMKLGVGKFTLGAGKESFFFSGDSTRPGKPSRAQKVLGLSFLRLGFAKPAALSYVSPGDLDGREMAYLARIPSHPDLTTGHCVFVCLNKHLLNAFYPQCMLKGEDVPR